MKIPYGIKKKLKSKACDVGLCLKIAGPPAKPKYKLVFNSVLVPWGKEYWNFLPISSWGRFLLGKLG